MLYRRQRSWQERAEGIGATLGIALMLVVGWLGLAWVLMLVVGNMYHAGMTLTPIGMWEAAYIIVPVYLPMSLAWVFFGTRG